MEAVEIDPVLELELGAELDLVRDAILLVAARAARRVVVANLHHGRAIEARARVIADEHGVRLGTLTTEDPRRLDIVAEQAAASPARAAEPGADNPVPVVTRIPRAAAVGA